MHLYHLPKDAPALSVEQAREAIVLDDAPLLQNDYLVKWRVDTGDRFQPMRYRDDGPVAELGPNELVDEGFRLAVEAADRHDMSESCDEKGARLLR